MKKRYYYLQVITGIRNAVIGLAVIASLWSATIIIGKTVYKYNRYNNIEKIAVMTRLDAPSNKNWQGVHYVALDDYEMYVEQNAGRFWKETESYYYISIILIIVAIFIPSDMTLCKIILKNKFRV